MKQFAVVFALALGACAPSMDEFQSAGGQSDARVRDYAACKIMATQTASGVAGAGSLIYNMQYNETLKDCMTAKGYTHTEAD